MQQIADWFETLTLTEYAQHMGSGALVYFTNPQTHDDDAMRVGRVAARCFLRSEFIAFDSATSEFKCA